MKNYMNHSSVFMHKTQVISDINVQ